MKSVTTLLIKMRLASIALTLATFTSVIEIPLPELNLIFSRLKNSSFSQAVLAQTPDERKRQADQLLNQGVQQFNISQYQAAMDSWQQALNLYRQINDQSGEGQALGSLGVIYEYFAEYATAIEYHQQALEIYRRIGDREGEGRTLNNLGNVYNDLGEYASAMEYYQQSLTIARSLGNRASEGKALGNLGLVYRKLGEYTTAISYHQQSLAIFREIGDDIGEQIELSNLGNAYLALREYTTAIEYFQQSLGIAQEIGNLSGQVWVLGSLGVAYKSVGMYEMAIESYQQSLTIARQIGDPDGESGALTNLGVAYSSIGEPTTAIEYFQQSLAISQQIGDLDTEGITLNNLGVIFLDTNQLNEAEIVLTQAIKVWETIRENLGNNDVWKVSIFENQTRTYRLLQQVLIAQNRVEDALEISERGRARAFVELMAQRLGNDSEITAKVDFPNLEQIKQVAQTQNATLVEYSLIFDEFLYIWVIEPSGEIAFRSVNLSQSETPLTEVAEQGRMTASTSRLRSGEETETLFTEIVRGTRDSIGNATVAAQTTTTEPRINQSLQHLHQLLIEPIADLLPSDPNQKVIFIPQGSLFLVPFAALQDKNGNYLIENHTILTAPAIQVLELTQQQPVNETGEILIVGNPTMPKISLAANQPPQQLTPLPGTEAEATAIAALLNTDFLSGDRATETVIKQKMPFAKLIHLATHGLLEETDNGMLAAIALTPGGNNDGLLTPDEILSLDLNADLVVLSACDTGIGKITGDGVVGLSRSILTAGARSAIVSLWKVPDLQTSVLMSEFYRQWQQTGNKAQALRQAMLTTMEQYPHPMNWAAFTIMGESD